MTQDERNAIVRRARAANPRIKPTDVLGVTKRSCHWNVFVVGSTFTDECGDVQRGRFLVYREPVKK